MNYEALKRLGRNLENINYTTKKGFLSALKRYKENSNFDLIFDANLYIAIKLKRLDFSNDEIENLLNRNLENILILNEHLRKIPFKGYKTIEMIDKLGRLSAVKHLLINSNYINNRDLKLKLLIEYEIKLKMNDLI